MIEDYRASREKQRKFLRNPTEALDIEDHGTCMDLSFLSLPELLFILQTLIYWCLLVHPILIPFNVSLCVSYTAVKLKHLYILCNKILHKSL